MTALCQTKAIHALLRSMPDFTDDDYRALLGREFRRKSSKGLSFAQAAKLIEMLKALGGRHETVRRAGESVTGRYAPKLRALWIAAYNLGIVRNRDDKALIAFVERQTGLSHTRFLVDAGDAAKAIEGLKLWIAREAGIEWPKDEDTAIKSLVCKAIARKCFETGAFKSFVEGAPFEDEQRETHIISCAWPMDFVSYGRRCGCPAGFEHYADEDWDTLASALGARLRRRLAAKAPAKKRKAA